MLTNPRKTPELAACARGAWQAAVRSVAESDAPEASKQQQSTDVTLSESASHSVTSSSLWPHGLRPTRLLCPWNYPGKNVGMGRHSLLQGIFLTQDQTRLSCIVGRFFTVWAITEARYDINLVVYLEICKMRTGQDNWSTSYTWKLLSKKLRSWSSVTYSLSQLHYKLGERPILVVNFPYQSFF